MALIIGVLHSFRSLAASLLISTLLIRAQVAERSESSTSSRLQHYIVTVGHHGPARQLNQQRQHHQRSAQFGSSNDPTIAGEGLRWASSSWQPAGMHLPSHDARHGWRSLAGSELKADPEAASRDRERRVSEVMDELTAMDHQKREARGARRRLTVEDGSAFASELSDAADDADNFEARVTGSFPNGAVSGFTAHLSPAAVEHLQSTRSDVRVWPDVTVRATWIGRPQPVHLSDGLDPRLNRVRDSMMMHAGGGRRLQDAQNGVADAAVNVSVAPSWGIDRIDQTALPLDGRYHRRYNGSGVDVYMVDSGVRWSHTDLVGRVKTGANFVPDQANDDFSDCAGHGTHITGTVAGFSVGVAKEGENNS